MRCTMAGMEGIEAKVLQVLPRFFQLLWCRREEMETPHDTSNPLLPAHGPGIFCDIADTRV